MKHLLGIAIIPFLCALISCTKEKSNVVDHEESPVFTATIDKSVTKTSINTLSGKVSWEKDDMITITDGKNIAIYGVDKFENERAFFVKKFGDDLNFTDVTYTATYGTVPQIFQDYSSSIGRLPMVAISTTNSLNFNVSCGLLKITLTKECDSIQKVRVTGTPYGSAETTFTLTCNPFQSIDTEKDFYIVLPAGSYYQYEFIDRIGESCVKIAKEGKSTIIKNNTITPVIFSQLDFGIVEFDDISFESYCLDNFDRNNDGVISREEALFVKTIDISNLNIMSTKGIERFLNLEIIDVTNNPQLEKLDISSCQMISCLNFTDGINITTNFIIGNYIIVNSIPSVCISKDKILASSIQEIKVGSECESWAKTFGNGWRLPTLSEYQTIIYQNAAIINNTIKEHNGIQIGLTKDYWYWCYEPYEPGRSRYVWLPYNNSSTYVEPRAERLGRLILPF